MNKQKEFELFPALINELNLSIVIWNELTWNYFRVLWNTNNSVIHVVSNVLNYDAA